MRASYRVWVSFLCFLLLDWHDIAVNLLQHYPLITRVTTLAACDFKHTWTCCDPTPMCVYACKWTRPLFCPWPNAITLCMVELASHEGSTVFLFSLWWLVVRVLTFATVSWISHFCCFARVGLFFFWNNRAFGITCFGIAFIIIRTKPRNLTSTEKDLWRDKTLFLIPSDGCCGWFETEEPNFLPWRFHLFQCLVFRVLSFIRAELSLH